MSQAPKSLRSFYGAREQARANTVKSMACPGEREQSVWTPPEILDPIRQMWPTITLDPCSGPDSIVQADHETYGPEYDEPSGLELPWAPYTYANPPFKDLRTWLEKASHEWGSGVRDILVLAPVRTHRTWWFRPERPAIAWLKPVRFLGHVQAFPAPLAMLYWGENQMGFEMAFTHISTKVDL